MKADDRIPEDYFLDSRIEDCELPSGKHGRIVTKEFDDAVHIKTMVRMIKELARLDVVPSFRAEKRLGAYRVVGGLPRFERFLTGVDLGLKERYPYHTLHPLAEMFFTVIPKLSVGGWDVQDHPGELINDYVRRLNEAVNELRDGAKLIKWQSAERNFIRGANKNKNSLMDLFHALSNKYSKLLVVRIDLGYMSGQGMEVDSKRSFFAKTMRQQAALRAMLKKNYGKDYVGYAIKVEYGLLKGYHHHAFFFFDGNKRRSDVLMGRWIGNAWSLDVNEGAGVYFNCNAHKESYRQCGIGMGRWDDVAFISGFEVAADYVTKPDEYMQIRKSKLGRTFCRSTVPRLPVVRRGRRRGL